MGPSPVPGGESGYEPFYPSNVRLDGSVKRFISHFFEVSDTPDTVDEWVDLFHDDATVIMGKDVAKGKDEIRKLRMRMCRDVEARKHRLVKVFPASFSSTSTTSVPLNEAEFMLFGAEAYQSRKDGQKSVVDWAGHALVSREKVTSQWRFHFYRVYLQK